MQRGILAATSVSLRFLRGSRGRFFRELSHHRFTRTMAAASSSTNSTNDPKVLSEQDWREKLTPEQFQVLRKKGTERPGTGEYDKVRTGPLGFLLTVCVLTNAYKLVLPKGRALCVRRLREPAIQRSVKV